MEKKFMLLLSLLIVLALTIYYMQQAPPFEIIGYQTVTGTITLKPSPINPAVNVYTLQIDGTVYYLIRGTSGYFPENVPWFQRHLGETVTVKGEVLTLNGRLSIRNCTPIGV